MSVKMPKNKFLVFCEDCADKEICTTHKKKYCPYLKPKYEKQVEEWINSRFMGWDHVKAISLETQYYDYYEGKFKRYAKKNDN